MKNSKTFVIIKYIFFAFLLIFVFSIANEFLFSSKKSQKKALQVADGEIIVGVTREPTNGLKETDLTDLDLIETIKEKIVDKVKKRGKEAFREQGGTGKFEADYVSEAWSLTVKNRNFILVKLSLNNMVHMKTIVGIQDNVFIKISGMKTGPDPVPHSYGPVAIKLKEIFGVSLPYN